MVGWLSAISAFSGQSKQGDEGILWQEDFTQPFQPESVMSVDIVVSENRVWLADKQRRGSSHLTFDIPIDETHHYLQCSLLEVSGEGYRCFGFKGEGESMDLGGGAVPGLYTFDIQQTYPALAAKGKVRMWFFVHGGYTEETPTPLGPSFKFDWLRVTSEPKEGVVMSVVGGGALKVGSKLMVTVWTLPGAKDVTFELRDDHGKTVLLTSDPYIQLKRLKPGGNVWQGEVTVEPGYCFTGDPPGAKPSHKRKVFMLSGAATVVGGGHEKLFTNLPAEVELE
jgi:hypothetical protein